MHTHIVIQRCLHIGARTMAICIWSASAQSNEFVALNHLNVYVDITAHVSRCWFIHYFPKPLRKILWDMFARQSGAYLNDYLFLRSVSEHKRIARKYFSHVENISVTRMKKKNFVNYNGNSKVRHFAANLMDLRYVGDIFAKVFTLCASTDLYLKK